jgi:hypothetical protein
MRPENRRPNSYYLGSAESPSSDSFSVWLKSSRSGDVVSPPCSPQVGSAPRPPSLYGRRLCRTVPAVVPARLVRIFASYPNIRGREYSGNVRRSLGADCSALRTLIKERGHPGAVSKRAGLAHTSRETGGLTGLCGAVVKGGGGGVWAAPRTASGDV